MSLTELMRALFPPWVYFLTVAALALFAAAAVQARARQTPEWRRWERMMVISAYLIVVADAAGVGLVLSVDLIAGVAVALAVLCWAAFCALPSQRLRVSSAQLFIAAPPQAVMTVLRDVSRQPEWMSSIASVSQDKPGPVDVGSRYRITIIPAAGLKLIAEMVVAERDDDRRIVLETSASAGRLRDTFTLLVQPTGTLVTSTAYNPLPYVIVVLTEWRRAAHQQQSNAIRADSLARLSQLVVAPRSDEPGDEPGKERPAH